MVDDMEACQSDRPTVLNYSKNTRKDSTSQCSPGNRDNEILLLPNPNNRVPAWSSDCSRQGKRVKDLTGRRFGKLTALYRKDEKRGSCYLWHCRCDCGRGIDVSSNALLSGNTQSCGCRRTETMQTRAKDIEGQTFGLLTAIGPTKRRKAGSVVWRCVCACGTEVDVPYNSLVSGNTKSCGCLKKKHDPPPLHYIDGTCLELLEGKKLRRDNTSGVTGVSKTKRGWQASIGFKGNRIHLGTYKIFQDAVSARKKAEREFFGDVLKEMK